MKFKKIYILFLFVYTFGAVTWDECLEMERKPILEWDSMSLFVIVKKNRPKEEEAE